MYPFINRFCKCVGKTQLTITLSFVAFTATAQIAPSLSFKNPVLTSGTALTQGAVYKFPLVMAGIDAFVTIQNLQNGATVTNIDQSGGVGYDDAFQPIVNSVSGSPNSLARFKIDFKTTAGVNYAFPDLAATGLDIDGTTMNELEFCTINMGGGNAKFQSNVSEINVVKSGGGFKASNITGNNFTGIDSSFKAVMYTVYHSAVNSLTIEFGAVRATGNGVRNYAAFFRDFIYPFQKALPLKLLSFTATEAATHVVSLKWSTSFETNTSHFIIEQSYDGQRFTDVAKVDANSNATVVSNYSKTIPVSTQVPQVYYRLRAVDQNGQLYFSPVCTVNFASTTTIQTSLFIYPNPCMYDLQITWQTHFQNKQMVLDIVSETGLLLSRSKATISTKQHHINMDGFRPGCYLLLVTVEGKTFQQRIIRQ